MGATRRIDRSNEYRRIQLVAKLHLLHHADGVPGRCEVCQPFDRAPHVPTKGTSTAPMPNGKLQGGLFLDGVIAFNVIDSFPEY